VGFDRTTVNPLNVTIPAGLDPLHPQARQVRGGLVYAGVNRAPAHQGDPPAVKPSPRAGLVFKIDDRNVVRGGYGIFWAPWNYNSAINLNQLPTEYLALGRTLTSLVPNPFFGVAGAGTLATQAMVQLNSLLVPYPQYGLNAVSMTTAGAHSLYNAAVLQVRKRVTGWWGGNFSYTYSRL